MVGGIGSIGAGSFYNYNTTRIPAAVPEGAKPVLNPEESDVKQAGRRSSPAECETCKNRKYQDGSDEMVSFKSPKHVSPQAAPSAVRGHEQEHVSNAFKKAAEKDGKVLQASVKIQTAVCPECGRTYVAGGETDTKIMYKNGDDDKKQQEEQLPKNILNPNGLYSGMRFDQGF